MKKLKKLFCFTMLFVTVLLLNNVKSYAAETQYTDNVIPAMTSATSSEGTASASSSYDVSFQAWRAFDHSCTSYQYAWATSANVTTGWLEYNFTNAKCITKYSLFRRAGGSANEMPKDWTFEAWDNQLGEWVILDTRSNLVTWVEQGGVDFTFTNNKTYNKYRLNIKANCGYAAYTAIGELQMMETKTNENPTDPTTPTDPTFNAAILELTMTNGNIKEFDLTFAELTDFLTWYDGKENGIGKSYYVFTKKINVKPFLSRKEYIAYKKISSFEVKEYNE